jgi:CheY-like chemotaxis protein
MDIDLKEAKEKAEESNKLKTAFLQNMSHEIRTPMNGIIGFSDMLMREELQEERRKFYTNIIVQSSKQLLGIVNDILDISKIETGQAETIETETNINQLLIDLFNFYKPLAWKKELGIFINTPLNNNESFIWVDYHKLKQVLENLLSNALKFTHKGHIRFGYRCSSSELIFYVEDTGIGIEKKYHEKIFEQFRQIELTSTREYGGNGLGLAISKAYVKLLNGKIWLISTKGSGAVFYFTIPYKPVLIEDIVRNEKKNPSKPSINRNKLVLIAEDEFANYVLLKEIIGELDVDVLHAKNGEEAVEIAKRSEVALVLLDIKMPKMNGYEAVTEIKKSRPSLPVVAQTAFATSTDKEKILGSGFDDYISKPIQNEKLYDILKKYLGIRAKNKIKW